MLWAPTKGSPQLVRLSPPHSPGKRRDFVLQPQTHLSISTQPKPLPKAPISLCRAALGLISGVNHSSGGSRDLQKVVCGCSQVTCSPLTSTAMLCCPLLLNPSAPRKKIGMGTAPGAAVGGWPGSAVAHGQHLTALLCLPPQPETRHGQGGVGHPGVLQSEGQPDGVPRRVRFCGYGAQGPSAWAVLWDLIR